jgi:hypothetical protein
MTDKYKLEKHCIVCGRSSDRPIRDALSHFKLYAGGNWRWFRGNMQTFGAWDGFWTSVGLVCPAYTTIRHWKYRKSSLTIGDIKDEDQP